jgi:hypothetical protein
MGGAVNPAQAAAVAGDAAQRGATGRIADGGGAHCGRAGGTVESTITEASVGTTAWQA